MRRTPLYSRATPPVPRDASVRAGAAPPRPAAAAPGRAHRLRRWATGAWRNPVVLWAALLLVGAGSLGWNWHLQDRLPPAITQDDIDAAVKQTLQTHVLPSPAARAYAAVGGAVVRVVGRPAEAKPVEPPAPGRKGAAPPRPDKPEQADDEAGPSVGTGVVILDNGTILTNYHVVSGAQRLSVTFANGLESPATLLRVDGANDLAVIKAERIPDDLQPATLGGTADLQPGDQVAAVGFPFGIGPSVSAGVVSGLHRAFRAGSFGERTGGRLLNDLIQFDAAANPGNSGGPLVNMSGEVVGIVTAILNPNEQRTFIGIGFAVPIESAAAAVGIPPF